MHGFLFAMILLLRSSCLFGAAQQSIVFWHQEIGDRQLIDELLHEFESDSGIRVESVTFATDQFKVGLIKQAQRGGLPDIALCPGDYVGIRREIELSTVPTGMKSPEIRQDLWQSTSVGGRVMGVPFILGNHLLLLYNKARTKNVPGSWEDIANLRRGRSGPIMGWNYSEMYWFAPFVLHYGANLVTEGKLTLNTKAMEEALKHYQQLGRDGIVDVGCSYDCGTRDFYSGKYDFAIDGDWSLTEARKALGNDLGIAPLPKLDGKPLLSYYSTMALLFPQNSLNGAKSSAIRRLVRFLVSKQSQNKLWQRARRIPVNTISYQNFLANADGNDKAMLEALKTAKLMPSETAMAFAWEALRRGFKQFMAGERSAEATAAAMQKDAETGLSSSVRGKWK